MTAHDSTTTDADLIAMWRHTDETGEVIRPFAAAEYDRLLVLLPDDEVVIADCKACAYPPACWCCDGRGYVARLLDGDDEDAPCPYCRDWLDDEPPYYPDEDDMDARYAAREVA